MVLETASTREMSSSAKSTTLRLDTILSSWTDLGSGMVSLATAQEMAMHAGETPYFSPSLIKAGSFNSGAPVEPSGE